MNYSNVLVYTNGKPVAFAVNPNSYYFEEVPKLFVELVGDYPNGVILRKPKEDDVIIRYIKYSKKLNQFIFCEKTDSEAIYVYVILFSGLEE